MLGEGVAGAVRGTADVVLVLVLVDGELSDLACLVRFFQAATEVQVRQLVILLDPFFCSRRRINVERTVCHPCRGQRP